MGKYGTRTIQCEYVKKNECEHCKEKYNEIKCKEEACPNCKVCSIEHCNDSNLLDKSSRLHLSIAQRGLDRDKEIEKEKKKGTI
jgi:hypothetical protein